MRQPTFEVSNGTMTAGFEEMKAGVRIEGRKINNLRYADDTTLPAEKKGECGRTNKRRQNWE
jgi:hypothetical protein